MATTVGQHSVATFTSPVNGTTPIDANSVRGNDNTLRTSYVDHDADPGIHVQSSTLASRPVAGAAGRKWITEDSGSYTLWFDDGTNWNAVSENSTLAEVLASGNTTGSTDIVVSAGQKIRTPLVAAQDGTSAITLADSTGALTLHTALADTNLATIATAGKVSNSATTATSANTASAIVSRDASGNFTAGTVTAALSGNASTATALQTARTINGVSFDGTANITVTAAAGTLTGTTLASNVVTSSLTSVGTLANLTVTNPITGSVTGSSGSTTGNAATATALQTARTINGTSFDGTANITVTAAAGTLTGTTLNGTVVSSSLTSVGTIGTGVWQGTAISDTYLATISTAGKVSNSATTATSANTASAIVARDASGNFTAGTITATLSGAAPAGSLSGTTLASNVVSSSLTSVGTLANLTVTNPISGSVTGSSGSTTGNAATATALQTARNINGVSFNGTADITVTAAAGTLSGSTLASGVTASSLTSVGTLSSLTVSGATTVSGGGASATPYTTLNGIRISGGDANNTIWNAGRSVSITADSGQNIYLASTSNGGVVGLGVNTTSGLVTAYNALTVSGDLTVDTSTLKVDSTNNIVGIGDLPSTLVYSGSSGVAPKAQVVATDNTTTLNATTASLVVQNDSTTDNSGTALHFVSRNTGNTRVAHAAIYGLTGTRNSGWNTGSLQFATSSAAAAPSVKMTLDSPGNLGLGVTPSAWTLGKAIELTNGTALWGYNTTSNYLTQNTVYNGGFKYAASAAAALYSQDTGAHKWFTAASGTAGNAITFLTAATLSGTADTKLRLSCTAGGAYKSELAFGGDGFGDAAGMVFSDVGGFVDIYASSRPLTFSTSTSGTATERARITSGGYLLVGTTATVDSGTSFKSSDPLAVYRSVNLAAGGVLSWWSDVSTTQSLKGYLRGDGGIANYSANDVNLSDVRTKKDITPLASYWDKLKAIEIVTFKYKDQTHDDLNIGVIAQQVEAVAPELVDIDGFGETPEDGVPLKTIYTTDLYHASIRALQEAMARIETLEARVAALGA